MRSSLRESKYVFPLVDLMIGQKYRYRKDELVFLKLVIKGKGFLDLEKLDRFLHPGPEKPLRTLHRQEIIK